LKKYYYKRNYWIILVKIDKIISYILYIKWLIKAGKKSTEA
jgi:hypothetical protein